MGGRVRFGIRAWLVLLLLFSVLPVTAFSAFIIFRLGSSQEAAVTADLLHRSELVAEVIDQRLQAMVAGLTALARSDAAIEGDVRGIHRHALRLMEEIPEAKLIALTGPEIQLFNTGAPSGVPLPVNSIPEVSREVFAGGKTVLSDVYPGSVFKQPAVSVNVPVRVGGKVTYTLRMAVVTTSFSDLLARQEIPPDGVVALFSQSGVVIGRSPDNHPVGSMAPLTDPAAAGADRRARVLDLVRRDGMSVKAALAPVGEWPWTVAIEVPAGSLTVDLRRSLAITVCGGILLLGLGLAGASWVSGHLARQIRGASAASAALGSGSDPVLPPTRIRELDELGRALGWAKSREDQVNNELTVAKAIEAQLSELIEQLRRSQDALAKQAERFQAILKTASDGIHVLDSEGNLVEASDSFLRMLGYDENEATALTIFDWEARYSPDELRACLNGLEIHGGTFETRHRRRDESLIDVEISARYVEIQGERYLYASARDITSRKAAEAEIALLAFYDSLTGLPNRRLLLDRLTQAKALSSRTGCHAALIFIDLDNFKTLNDTQGHKIGDQLLTEVAARLRSSVREADTVARLGGDEFVVMLEDLSLKVEEAAAGAELAADKILRRLSAAYRLAGRSHHTTASLGITLFRDKDVSNDEILKQADMAMYQAKAAGRNTKRFFDPAMQAALAARSVLEAELRRAVERAELFLLYQPQVDRSGRLLGGECLLRWRHPTRGVVLPADYLPLAEETDLIVTIDQQVLAMTCGRLAAWAADSATRELSLSVNLSARQFRQPHFVDQIRTLLEKSGANPARLKLELTESVVLQDVEGAAARMEALRKMGIAFALDDFGTGYSSMAYLKMLPFSELKIDRSFVRDILTDPNDAVIARTIIALGRSLGFSVVAEGVEEAAQWDMLCREGCERAQGHLFGRPVEPEAFVQMVRNWDFGRVT